MIIVGCDFHTRFQQIAMVDPKTGELVERRLEHETGEARSFYASLSEPTRVGIEATVNAQWFEGLAMNAASRAPLTPLPARKTGSVS